MTNVQLFPYPKVNLKFNKDLIAPDVIPDVKIKLIWERLLGKDNKELIITSLVNSVKFSIFVEKTKEEFKNNYSDLRKFPKMNDDDWK